MDCSLNKQRVVALAALAAALLLTPGLSAAEAAPPRLVLQVTVDALRGDLPGRYAHLFGDGGFRYLMEDGVHYTNAHYQHANTETIVGHVSLATGSVPAAHGMVGNVWFDREGGRLIYNIEDPNHHLLTAGAGVEAATVSRPVTPYDVAPTLSNYLGVKPPSGAIGNPLVEVVGD